MSIENYGQEQSEKEPIYQLVLERTAMTRTMGPESEIGGKVTFFKLRAEDGEMDDLLSRLLKGGYRMAFTCATEKEDDPKKIEEENYFSKRMEAVREVLMRSEVQEKIRELLELRSGLQEDLRCALTNTERITEEHHSQLKVRNGIVPLSELRKYRNLAAQEIGSNNETVEKFRVLDKRVSDLRDAMENAKDDESECKRKLAEWDKVFDRYGEELRQLVEAEQEKIEA